MQNNTVTDQLVTKIQSVTFPSLPAAAIDMAKAVALDGLAVILAGATEPLGVGRLSIEYIKSIGGTPQSTVMAGGFKTSMPNAAYVNGTMAHALDWDNTMYPTHHPTSPTLPAILAIAEAQHLPGTKVIEAIVTAFEVQARLRLASTGLHIGQGFHKPGITGTFGATAAAARLFDLDRQQTLMALGLAGSRAGSIALNTGTMTKSSHSGHAARMGVECGMLAKIGWTAHADVFGPEGYFDTFLGGEAIPELLYKDFGAPYRMVEPGVGFKKHPSNYFTHRPIDAAIALRTEFNLVADQIERIEIVFPPFEYVNRPDPRSGLDGKFSIQYTTLIALLDGKITVDSFTNERRFADDVMRLLPQVKLTFDESIPRDLADMHIIVNVWLKDGRALSNKLARLTGFQGIPLTREQRLSKFFSASERVLDEARAQRILALVERLEELSDIGEVMDLVRDPAA